MMSDALGGYASMAVERRARTTRSIQTKTAITNATKSQANVTKKRQRTTVSTPRPSIPFSTTTLTPPRSLRDEVRIIEDNATSSSSSPPRTKTLSTTSEKGPHSQISPPRPHLLELSRPPLYKQRKSVTEGSQEEEPNAINRELLAEHEDDGDEVDAALQAQLQALLDQRFGMALAVASESEPVIVPRSDVEKEESLDPDNWLSAGCVSPPSSTSPFSSPSASASPSVDVSPQRQNKWLEKAEVSVASTVKAEPFSSSAALTQISASYFDPHLAPPSIYSLVSSSSTFDDLCISIGRVEEHRFMLLRCIWEYLQNEKKNNKKEQGEAQEQSASSRTFNRAVTACGQVEGRSVAGAASEKEPSLLAADPFPPLSNRSSSFGVTSISALSLSSPSSLLSLSLARRMKRKDAASIANTSIIVSENNETKRSLSSRSVYRALLAETLATRKQQQRQLSGSKTSALCPLEKNTRRNENTKARDPDDKNIAGLAVELLVDDARNNAKGSHQAHSKGEEDKAAQPSRSSSSKLKSEIGTLPSASFHLLESAMPHLLAEVFFRFLRYRAAVSRERRVVIAKLDETRSLRRSFLGWRGLVGNQRRWDEAMVREVIYRLHNLVDIRRRRSNILSNFVNAIQQRAAAREALLFSKTKRLFHVWRTKARSSMTASKLLAFAKANAGRPSSSLLKLALRPTRAVTAVRAVILQHSSSANSSSVHTQLTPAEIGKLTYRTDSLQEGQWQAQIKCPRLLDQCHSAADDDLLVLCPRPALTNITNKERLRARIPQGRMIPKLQKECDREEASVVAEGADTFQYRTLVRRIVFGHWRVQLQRRRDLRDVDRLRRQHVLGVCLGHWRRSASQKLSVKKVEAFRSAEALRVAVIQQERAARGETQPLRRLRAPSLRFVSGGDEVNNNNNESEFLNGELYTASGDVTVREGNLPFVGLNSDGVSSPFSVPPHLPNKGFTIVHVASSLSADTNNSTLMPFYSGELAIKLAYVESTAISFHKQCLLAGAIDKWRSQLDTRIADRHAKTKIRKDALAKWYSRAMEKSAHQRIKQLLFGYWRERLRQYRLRLLSDDWRRSHLATVVVSKWATLAKAERQKRVFRLACVLTLWREKARAAVAATKLRESKKRRHFAAWWEHVLLRRKQKGQCDLAEAISARVRMVKIIRKWRTATLVSRREALVFEIADSIRTRRLLSRVFSYWTIKTAERQQHKVEALRRLAEESFMGQFQGTAFQDDECGGVTTTAAPYLSSPLWTPSQVRTTSDLSSDARVVYDESARGEPPERGNPESLFHYPQRVVPEGMNRSTTVFESQTDDNTYTQIHANIEIHRQNSMPS